MEVWSREMNSEDCCDAVLSQWLHYPPRRYPATWEGLCELLDDCELGELASELKLAVSNAVCQLNFEYFLSLCFFLSFN